MMRLIALPAALGVLFVFAAAGQAVSINPEKLKEWKRDDVRIVTDMPGDFDAKKPTVIVIFALPNGSTVEQTMGAKLLPGMDWHFDIQHIAAQTRKVREVDPDRNIVVAYLEAQAKSLPKTWPGWRKEKGEDNGKIIRSIVEEIEITVRGKNVRIELIAHSGGGSFIFGYINGGDAIGDDIERISWIDADYAYDEEQDHHGTKLLNWLKDDSKRHLVVFAYNDRAATLNGKPFVSETGGTFYRSHKMVEFLGQNTKLIRTDHAPFEEYNGMSGQIHFMLHTNPEKKILHTVLVERNGFLEAVSWDTPFHDKWGGTFWGDRAYMDLVSPTVAVIGTQTPATTEPATTQAAKAQATTGTAAVTGIPARPGNAVGGKMFAETIAELPPKARENAIVSEIEKGNIPDFQRKFVDVKVTDGDHTIVYSVIPDYLAVGSDKDFVRMPMTPGSAKQIADAFGCTLTTRKMCADIYTHAALKLEPKPLTDQREAVRTYVQSNELINEEMKGKPLGELVAGDKKDVVISAKLKDHPGKVAIYGWHKLDGKAIQPLYLGHGDFYADYSHGIRLVKEECMVDGKKTTVQAVLKDPELCKLLSDEGSIEGGY